MPGEQPDKPETTQEPTLLNYASHLGEYPQQQTLPGLVVALVAFSALAGIWSIILGVVSLTDLWFFGLLLIAAGMCLCWGTIGKLSAKGMRLKPALIFIVSSIVIYVPVVVISNQDYDHQYTRYARDLQMEQSDWRHTPTEAEGQVFTYKMIRDNAAISTALGLGCCIYATTRLLARRGVDLN